VNRHRIFRRGLPYGEWVPEGTETPEHDKDRGVAFMLKGGDYVFVPGITALQLIAEGKVPET
jgi:deferrochelatase/peroxidase EfeB